MNRGVRLWQAPLVRSGLALAAGALLVLAFAPFDQWELGFLAPALLFLVWEGAPPPRAALFGLCFGIGLFGFGIDWIVHSIAVVGHEPPLLAWGLVSSLTLACAVFTAGVGWAAARLAPRPGFSRYALVLPALWVLAEWVRGWILTGFPWLDLGYSAVGQVLAQGYAPVLGTLGVSFVLALTAGLIVASVRLPAPAHRWGALALLSAVWLLSPALSAIHWIRPDGPPITVSVVQGDIPQRMKFRPGAWRSGLARYEAMSRMLWHPGRVVVWPESAVSTWYEEAIRPLRRLRRRIRAHGATLMTGIFHYDFRNGGRYNAAVRIGSGPVRFYDKHHLVPYGEYFPVPAFVRAWLRDWKLPHSSFTKGPAVQPPFRVDGRWAGISICYEDAFGRDIRRALPKANWLVNVSDDAWFGRTIGPDQQFQMARMRALETGRPLVRADNTAISGLIDARGRLIGQLPPFLPLVLTGSVQPEAGLTPYDRWGDRPIVILAGVLLWVGAFWGTGRRRPQDPRHRPGGDAL
jgi:apolipoprotein N-acyltransferase